MTCIQDVEFWVRTALPHLAANPSGKCYAAAEFITDSFPDLQPIEATHTGWSRCTQHPHIYCTHWAVYDPATQLVHDFTLRQFDTHAPDLYTGTVTNWTTTLSAIWNSPVLITINDWYPNYD